ncbi:metallophosphatase [Spongiimicrobium salis]|uniref:metallophosphatase n=1 Tax=Spongiimicrobium salis TaxID=1667022 RepID=UPI00374D54F6
MKNIRLMLVFLSVLAFYRGFSQEIETSIFITGNTGEAEHQQLLSQIMKDSRNVDEATLLILGNAMKKGGFANPLTMTTLEAQLSEVKKFKGKSIFVPGPNEWEEKDHKGVRKLEKFIQKNSDAKFYPDGSCPIKKKELSDNVVLITIDSQWYLEDWDAYTYLNEDCDIKNRTLFFLEFEAILKKAQDKIKIVAVHHPVYTNSRQGLLRNTAAFSSQDFQSKQYRGLRNRLATSARQMEKVIFVSAHDKNLQYMNPSGVAQIISGAPGSTRGVKKSKEGEFSSTKNGYARLDIYDNGKVTTSFHSGVQGKSEMLFSTMIFDEKKENGLADTFRNKESYGKTKKASIYTKEETQKGGTYTSLWGKHYRQFYGKQIDAPVVFLDTLWGGLKPVKKGGGQQSKSLRIEDKSGKQYVMRALKKSTTKFLQANAFQDTYIGNALDGTAVDKFLLDFYTTSNPYTPFVMGGLSDAVGVFHTNPILFYVPKQAALGKFNKDFGDELYMIEEHVGSTQTDLVSFGSPKKILSTADVIQEIHKTGRSVIDEPSYIRARLFDMLVGDWDRHEDQWRWALFENEDGTEICKPIPRDRDQAFSKYDGALISFLTRAIPGLRKMQTYDEELRSPKWFALSPYHIDVNFITNADWKEWEKQAKHLQENLTDADIEKAFENIPEEIKGSIIEDIKTKLKGRRANIVAIAKEYFDYLNRFEVIVGTQKDDKFEIVRHDGGKTSIAIHRKDLGIFNRTFTKDVTKEIWLYGLDGKDTFTVSGEGDQLIKLKVLGGKKNDTYDFKNTRKVKLYDYASKKNTIVNKISKKWLVDDYEVNNYDHKKLKHSANQVLPIIAANPDDGLRIGVIDNYTFHGIQANPFTQKHTFKASYYTGTSGYDLSYRGEFSNIFHRWNFALETSYNSPNFARNFFGFGNDTEYDKDAVDLDFNRVRIRKWDAAVSLIYRGRNGGSFHFKPLVESFRVENTQDRFINTVPANNTIFDQQTYGGVEVAYEYENKDNAGYPTLGFDAEIRAGYKTNIDGGAAENSFAYVQPQLVLDHKLTSSGFLVLATKIGGNLILGDDFEFYHAATLGGNNNLRGFRNERFTGKYSAYHNTDLRLALGKLKTSIIPLRYGITGSFDYGRVWTSDDNSSQWHNSPGGSFWLNGLGFLTANLGYFGSDDGGRVVFVLGFSF